MEYHLEVTRSRGASVPPWQVVDVRFVHENVAAVVLQRLPGKRFATYSEMDQVSIHLFVSDLGKNSLLRPTDHYTALAAHWNWTGKELCVYSKEMVTVIDITTDGQFNPRFELDTDPAMEHIPSSKYGF